MKGKEDTAWHPCWKSYFRECEGQASSVTALPLGCNGNLGAQRTQVRHLVKGRTITVLWTAFYLLYKWQGHDREKREKLTLGVCFCKNTKHWSLWNPVDNFFLKTVKSNNNAKFYAKLLTVALTKYRAILTSSFTKQGTGQKNTNVFSTHCRTFKEQMPMLVYQVDNLYQTAVKNADITHSVANWS